MNKLIGAIVGAVMVIGITGSAFAQSFPSSYRGTPFAGDPCLSFNHISAPIALASATTSKVVSLTANQDIYICGLSESIIASATAGLSYGTGTLCATGITTVTGPMAGAAVVSTGDSLGTKLFVPAGNDVCIVGTGAGADVAGFLTYVKVDNTMPR